MFFSVPSATPTNVQAVYYNSTAIKVEWNPVPEDRDSMKGILTGYRVSMEENYIESGSFKIF